MVNGALRPEEPDDRRILKSNALVPAADQAA
jgi:hypothetical protein